MKIFAAILSLFVLFLSAVPVKAHEEESTKKHSCCKVQKEVPNNKHTSKGCCDKGCNPFLSCCSMMGFIPQESNLTFKKELISKEKFELYSENAISRFKGEAWHPPKV
ncbi:MAG: hypothetical protein NT150_01910 [Bacteroidetes bacterium]|nr:hypothetical protein [Bacteroidota bacterium]